MYKKKNRNFVLKSKEDKNLNFRDLIKLQNLLKDSKKKKIFM